MKTNMPVRPLHIIAREIYKDWNPRVHCTAAPCLSAMLGLTTITDRYGCDEGKSIVAYFLCNASSWKGEVARRVKKELNDLLKSCHKD